MRRPVFARWIKKRCVELAGATSFNMRSLAALSQKGTSEPAVESREGGNLLAGLELYAMANGYESRLKSFLWDEQAIDEFAAIQEAISGRDMEMLALRGTPLRSLPKPHQRLMAEFADEYHRPERVADRKAQLCEEAIVLLKKTGVPYALIAEKTGIAIPNLSSYFKHKSVGKVTLEGAESIRDFLVSYANGEI